MAGNAVIQPKKNIIVFLTVFLIWLAGVWIVWQSVYPDMVRQEVRESARQQQKIIDQKGFQAHPEAESLVLKLSEALDNIPRLDFIKAFKGMNPILQSDVIDSILPADKKIFISISDNNENVLAKNNSPLIALFPLAETEKTEILNGAGSIKVWKNRLYMIFSKTINMSTGSDSVELGRIYIAFLSRSQPPVYKIKFMLFSIFGILLCVLFFFTRKILRASNKKDIVNVFGNESSADSTDDSGEIFSHSINKNTPPSTDTGIVIDGNIVPPPRDLDATRIVLPSDTSDESDTKPDITQNEKKSLFSILGNGDHIDEQYSILEILGQGGAGIVYKVKDTLMDRIFAIKVLNNDQLIKGFIIEANVGIDLYHENIVKVHPLRKDKHHGFYYLVMDYIEGCNLKKWLREHPEVTYEQTLYILRYVCDGLQYAHDKETCHRDVKPENIMICDRGQKNNNMRVSLVDFGLSKLKDGEGDVTRFSGAGTFKYMPPEQRQGNSDYRADIYSVGVISFLMLTGGQIPDEPGNTNINSVNPLLSSEVGDVLNRAMSHCPSDRYKKISLFFEALYEAVKNSDISLTDPIHMEKEELEEEDPTV